jgi:hypothetical protein
VFRVVMIIFKRSVVAALAALALAAPAQAVEWRPGSVITPPYQYVTDIQADVGFSSTVAVWRDGTSLFWRERPTAGTFAAPVEKLTGDQIPHQYVLAGGLRGDRIVAYATDDAVWVARKPIGQPFGAPAKVADAAGVGTLSAALGPNGDAIVAWTVGGRLDAAVSHDGGGTFGTPATLAADATQGAEIAFDAEGRALVVWGEPSAVGVARHAASGGLEEMRPLPALPFVGDLALGVTPKGRAVIGYTETPGKTTQAHVAASLGTTAGEFAAPKILSGPFARDVDVAVENDVAFGTGDRAAITWRAASGRNSRVQAAVSNLAGTEWGATKTLSDRNARLPSAAITRGNEVRVAWQRLTSSGRAVEAAVRQTTKWGAAQRLSSYGVVTGPTVAVGTRGDTFVGWSRDGKGLSRIENRKISSNGTLTRVLVVYEGRVRSGERVDEPTLYRAGPGAVAIYQRVIESSRRSFWDLATYDEGRSEGG